MRALALLLGATAGIGMWADDLPRAQVYAVLAVAASVLSLGDGWFGRTWREAYGNAKRENESRIDLP